MGSAGAFDNFPLHLTVEKLNGKNYREWPQAIKLVIDGKWKARVSYRQDSTTTSDRCSSIPKMVVRKLFHHLMLDQLHEVSHLGNLYVPFDGKGCVGCDMGNILWCRECFPNLRIQDATLVDGARGSRSCGILHRDVGFVARSRFQPRKGMRVHGWQCAIQEEDGERESLRVSSGTELRAWRH